MIRFAHDLSNQDQLSLQFRVGIATGICCFSLSYSLSPLISLYLRISPYLASSLSLSQTHTHARARALSLSHIYMLCSTLLSLSVMCIIPPPFPFLLLTSNGVHVFVR